MMLKQKTNPSAYFFGLMAFLLLSAPTMTSAEPLYDLGNNWYKMSVSVSFRNNSYHDRVSLYANKQAVSGQTVRGVFKPIPDSLKAALFSDQTINPFRAVFNDVQAAHQRGQLNNCPFVGVELSLNEHSQSQEWLISAPVSICLTGSYQRSREPDSHVWLLQRNAQGRYQVLMESAGVVQVIDEAAGGYKQLQTRLYNYHLSEGNQQACGYGSISWVNRGGRYWPTRLFSKVNGCDRHLPNANEQQRFQQVEEGVLLGLRRITGRVFKRADNGSLVY